METELLKFSLEKDFFCFMKNAALPFLIIEKMFLLSEREGSTEAVLERETLNGSSSEPRFACPTLL